MHRTRTESERRIFIGLTEVAGFCANLKKGFGDLGVACTFVALKSHPYEYGGETTNWLVRLARATAAAEAKNSQATWRRLSWRGARVMSVGALFAWAIAKHDTFIFVAGSTFLGLRELPLLRFLGKKVIFVFLGSDSRPPFCSGRAFDRTTANGIVSGIASSRLKKACLQRIDRWASVVVDHPLAAHFHTGRIVKFTSLGLPYSVPVSVKGELEVRTKASVGMVRVLHAPSNPLVKGTSEIRAIIGRLKEKGVPIEYIEVQHVRNDVLLGELARCDVVLDQLYSDTPLAGLGTQAAFLMKPTVVGGYGQEELLRFYAEEEIPPSFYCKPEEVEDVLERVVCDRALREAMGQRVQSYVEKHCSPRAVASKFLVLMSESIPAEWTFTPSDVRYLHGWGIRESDVRENLRTLLEQGGRVALLLSDKPELEESALRFATSDGPESQEQGSRIR